MKDDRSNKSLIDELRVLFRKIGELDFKTTFVLLAVAVISTVNYYYGNRSFMKDVFVGTFPDRSQLVYMSVILRNIARFLFSFVLPLILIKWPLKGRFRDYGLGVGDWRFGVKITIIFVLAMLPVLWFASASESFARTYPACPGVKADWGKFLLFVSTYFIYMTGWEFLWRGFMLFGLKNKLGYYAIFVQTIPFVILHYGKPSAESFGAIFAGVALGILAWRSKSFWYPMLTHTAVIISINTIAVLRFRTGNYGIALHDLIEVLGGIVK